MIRRAAWLSALALPPTCWFLAASSSAETIDPKRPRTLIVGGPRGTSPTARADVRRTGFSKDPLPTGTLKIASGTDLATFDADGIVRARADLDEPVFAPPVAALGKIALVTLSGKVFLWTPGREPQRVGAFGGFIDARRDEGVALAEDHTL